MHAADISPRRADGRFLSHPIANQAVEDGRSPQGSYRQAARRQWHRSAPSAGPVRNLSKPLPILAVDRDRHSRRRLHHNRPAPNSLASARHAGESRHTDEAGECGTADRSYTLPRDEKHEAYAEPSVRITNASQITPNSPPLISPIHDFVLTTLPSSPSGIRLNKPRCLSIDPEVGIKTPVSFTNWLPSRRYGRELGSFPPGKLPEACPESA